MVISAGYCCFSECSYVTISPSLLTTTVSHCTPCHRSLPLHWALARDNPSLEVVYVLVGAYPEGLFDADYQGDMPYDK
jgi:hypothetical protein